MSDFKDTLKEALENGMLLDSCGKGYADRGEYYTYGVYTDLCGLDLNSEPEPGPTPTPTGKTENKISVALNNKVVTLTSDKSVDTNVTVKVSYYTGSNKTSKTVSGTILKGASTGTISINDEARLYEINSISTSSTSSEYDYKKGTVATGTTETTTTTLLVDGDTLKATANKAVTNDLTINVPIKYVSSASGNIVADSTNVVINKNTTSGSVKLTGDKANFMIDSSKTISYAPKSIISENTENDNVVKNNTPTSNEGTCYIYKMNDKIHHCEQTITIANGDYNNEFGIKEYLDPTTDKITDPSYDEEDWERFVEAENLYCKICYELPSTKTYEFRDSVGLLIDDFNVTNIIKNGVLYNKYEKGDASLNYSYYTPDGEMETFDDGGKPKITLTIK